MDGRRLAMRQETRRATADVCGVLLSRYGIVPSFEVVYELALSIDGAMREYARRYKPMTPDQVEKEDNNDVVVVNSDK